ncbi:MAG: hypothetical protein LT070_05660 [Solirubrobacteraceae bacterium]|nr:hypothetical protein [Solirubrobacteraceae bacterium]
MVSEAPALTATPLRLRAVAVLLALPLLGLVLLLGEPRLDVHWEHHPSHFWLVLTAAALNAGLAVATGSSARRRGDARVFLVSMAFLCAAGFLGLHALATPGVLLAGSNHGFAIATPVGLFGAALFAAAASAPLSGERGRAIIRRAAWIQWGLVAVMALWATMSLGEIAPLGAGTPPERATGPLVVPAALGVALYAFAVVRFLRLARAHPSNVLLGMVVGCALLGEAMVAVAFGRNWHATWWEWHLLMLAAFAVIAWSAHREWHEERWSALYLPDTAAGTREVTVLFADLQGFTSFSERHRPREVSEMLNEYFERAIPPIVERHGGEVDRLIGDAVMAVWGRRGDQPDHAERAARAALDIQRATGEVSAAHPDWPRFRVGVNSGEVLVGVLGAAGGRTHTMIGDAVNLAARLEAQAPVGGVAIGPETLRRLPHARTEPLGSLRVKGKAEPVEAYRLLDVD